MLMSAVARIHYWRIGHAREMLWRTGHRVTNDDAIGRHCFEVSGRVEQCFAFADTGCRNTDVYRISRQTLRGDLERRSGPGRRFEEKINDRAATQRRDLLNLTF